MHSYFRPIPFFLFLLAVAYIGWQSLRWLRSAEKKLSKSEKFNSVKYTLMFAFLYWAAATGTTFAIGFLPEAFLSRYYINTGIEPFAPVIAAIGLALGIAFSGRGARWTWLFGLLWLSIGIYEIRGSGSWAHAMETLFAPTSACSDSECLGELLFTMPSVASVAFSVGAHIARFLSHLFGIASENS